MVHGEVFCKPAGSKANEIKPSFSCRWSSSHNQWKSMPILSNRRVSRAPAVTQVSLTRPRLRSRECARSIGSTIDLRDWEFLRGGEREKKKSRRTSRAANSCKNQLRVFMYYIVDTHISRDFSHFWSLARSLGRTAFIWVSIGAR